MAFVYIKVPLEMRWHCDMVANLWKSLPIVPTANPFQLSMLLPVLKEDFQFRDIMKSEVLQLLFLQKSVPMFV